MSEAIEKISSSNPTSTAPVETIWNRWHLLRLISLLEALITSLGFFVIVWLVGPGLGQNGLGPVLIAVLALFFFYIAYLSPVLIHKDSLKERGLGTWKTLFVRTDNLATAFWPYFWLALTGGIAIITIALVSDPDIFSKIVWKAFFLKLALYIFNAFGQGLLFLSFLLTRLRVLFPVSQGVDDQRRATLQHQLVVSLMCALFFSISHLPNFPLMIVTLFMGFAVSWIYYRTPNLLLAAVAHATIGTLLHQVLQMHMRIGPFYWENEKYVFRTLFPVLREIIGDLY